MVTPAARREAVAHLRTSLGMSERRACGIIGADRTSMRYRSKRGDDTALRVRRKRKPLPTVDGLCVQAVLAATASLQFQGRSSLSL